MTTIRVDSNSREVSQAMRDLFRDQVPFVLQQAVRRTALDVQEAQRAHQRGVFTIRRQSFMDRAVKIRDWPTRQDPTAIVRIEPVGGPTRARMITDHEDGGRRSPGPGRRSVAVPQAARPSPRELVPKHLRPKRLQFTRMLESGAKDPGAASKAYVQVFRGLHRTFMIRYRDGAGFIFQRRHHGTTGTLVGTRLLYVLEPGGVELSPVLQFGENAAAVVAERWDINVGEAWDRALRTAR
jgi:hypothetical protein